MSAFSPGITSTSRRSTRSRVCVVPSTGTADVPLLALRELVGDRDLVLVEVLEELGLEELPRRRAE